MTKRKNAAAQKLGKLGGAKNSPAQNAARKRNAQLAGRPRRVCVHCGEKVIGGHVDKALDKTCGAHGWTWAKAHEAASTSVNPYELLADVLIAFENEENSVQAEHADLIDRVRSAIGHLRGLELGPGTRADGTT